MNNFEKQTLKTLAKEYYTLESKKENLLQKIEDIQSEIDTVITRQTQLNNIAIAITKNAGITDIIEMVVETKVNSKGETKIVKSYNFLEKEKVEVLNIVDENPTTGENEGFTVSNNYTPHYHDDSEIENCYPEESKDKVSNGFTVNSPSL